MKKQQSRFLQPRNQKENRLEAANHHQLSRPKGHRSWQGILPRCIEESQRILPRANEGRDLAISNVARPAKSNNDASDPLKPEVFQHINSPTTLGYILCNPAPFVLLSCVQGYHRTPAMAVILWAYLFVAWSHLCQPYN